MSEYKYTLGYYPLELKLRRKASAIALSVFLLIALLPLVIAPQSAHADITITWDGGGDDTSFSDPLNWDTDTVPEASGTWTTILIDGREDVNSVVHLDVRYFLELDMIIKIDSGDELIIDNGVSMWNVGSINNFGTFSINAGGSVDTYVGGSITNNAGGIVNNNGRIHTIIVNNGGIVNNNNFANSIINNAGSTFNNNGSMDRNLDGLGVSIENKGSGSTFNNNGNIQAERGIVNNDGGTFNNNDGATINIPAGATSNNNNGEINNNAGGEINNAGTIENSLGTIINECGATFNNIASGTITGNPVLNESCDVVPPVISITSPSDDQVLSSNTVAVSGVSSDDFSGVKNAWVRVDMGSYRAVTPSTPGDYSAWTVTQTITTAGLHTLTAKVTDNAGKSSWHTIGINVQFGTNIDSAKPTITITSPSTGATITGPSSRVAISVAGTASDDFSGVKNAWVRVDMGSYRAVTPSTPGDYSAWTVTQTITTAGLHTLTAKVTDNAGKSSWHIIEVNIAFSR